MRDADNLLSRARFTPSGADLDGYIVRYQSGEHSLFKMVVLLIVYLDLSCLNSCSACIKFIWISLMCLSLCLCVCVRARRKRGHFLC